MLHSSCAAISLPEQRNFSYPFQDILILWYRRQPKSPVLVPRFHIILFALSPSARLIFLHPWRHTVVHFRSSPTVNERSFMRGKICFWHNWSREIFNLPPFYQVVENTCVRDVACSTRSDCSSSLRWIDYPVIIIFGEQSQYNFRFAFRQPRKWRVPCLSPIVDWKNMPYWQICHQKKSNM